MNDKEKFTAGMGSLLDRKPTKEPKAEASREISVQEQTRRERAGRHKNGDDREKLTANNMYTSLAIDKDLYAKIRIIAQVNGLPYKDLLNAALSKYIELYEKKHGPVTTSRESNISAESLI